MFWFVFVFALLVYGTCHIVSVYREKAMVSGESKIGLFEQSKCPFCKNCKILALITFIIAFFTVFVVSYSEYKELGWSFLSLNHATWEFIHVSMISIFIVLLAILTYIHQEAFAVRVKKLLHVKSN